MRILSPAMAVACVCLLIAALPFAAAPPAASGELSLSHLFIAEHTMYPAHPEQGSAVSRTEIHFVIVQDGPVRLRVFDRRGGRVRTLVDGFRRAGTYESWWDGRRDDGTRAPAGFYWLALWAPAEGTRQALPLLGTAAR